MHLNQQQYCRQHQTITSWKVIVAVYFSRFTNSDRIYAFFNIRLSTPLLDETLSSLPVLSVYRDSGIFSNPDPGIPAGLPTFLINRVPAPGQSSLPGILPASGW
jgi:hypothetical protein